MPQFETFFGGKSAKSTTVRPAKKRIQADQRGCEFCPLNKVHGIHKIKGTVHGDRKIFVWAMCPGRTENEQRKELVGDSGKLLWDTLETVGIYRKQCEVQNVVRCFSSDLVDGEYLKMRNPSKEELHCCSKYTDRALEKSNARVHLVLGQVAQKQFLGAEYKKNKKVFYSDRLQAWVVCAAHPAYFVRRGEGGQVIDINTKSNVFKQWVSDLAQVATLSKVSGGRFRYIEKQNYQAVVTAAEARRAKRKLVESWERKKERWSVDFEEGLVRNGVATSKGRPTALVIGFSPEPGTSYVFWLNHPDLPKPRTARDRKTVWKIAQWLLRYPARKAFQHGNYDLEAVQRFMGVSVRGYDYDTEYGEYFRDPDAKAYGLTAIAARRFPRMSGYKQIVLPESLTSDFIKRLPPKLRDEVRGGTADWSVVLDKARKEHGANLAKLPWKKMLLYNGADCDIQKRIEITTRKYSNPALMRLYIQAGMILARMEQDGPLFDYRQHKILAEYYPQQEARLLEEIREWVRKATKRKPTKIVKTKKDSWHALDRKSWKIFNPNSGPQVLDLLYNWLKLPLIKTKKTYNRKTGAIKATSDKEVMILLTEHHVVPKLIQEIRHIRKIRSTYLDGFLKCANANDGRLRTKWWSTGAGTGRISSGGGGNRRQTEEDLGSVVNLQNILSDPQLQCLVISDQEWWKLQRFWEEHGPFMSDSEIPDWVWDLDIFLGADHSQMELRVLAQKSRDKEYIKIFQDRTRDPHSEVGHVLTGWPVERIINDDRTRRVVKNMQFGIVFGLNEDNLFDYMVAKGVFKYSDGSAKGDQEEKENRERVRKFHRKYFRRFKGVARMIEKDRDFVERHGYMQTLTGLRRRLDVSGDSGGHAFWGNQAVNGPIQGTASHVMIMGLTPLIRQPERYKLLNRPQLEIHDALYNLVKLRNLWKALKRVREMLEKEPVKILRKEFKIDWTVPLKVDAKAGFRFGVMVKDLDDFHGENKTAQFLNKWCEKNRQVVGMLVCTMHSHHRYVKQASGQRACSRCGAKTESK